MKILTPEEEQAHYNATVRGGLTGGAIGLAVSSVGVWAASRRFPMFRQLSLPFKAFLLTSGGSFAAIIQADRSSRRYDIETNPLKKQLEEEERQQAELLAASKDGATRAKEWATNNRYSIVFGAWLASMGASFGIVARNPYLSTAQKIVQARVWAQGLTLAVLLASFALEANDANQGKGRWEMVKVLDPNDPTHSHYVEKKIHHERYQGEDMWREMVEAEERKMKEREAAKNKQQQQVQQKEQQLQQQQQKQQQ
ncbi:hypothetical protein IWX90DRAFT_181746 [Phyllosticta citrichinensis]|uniref:HIG1 domain-containing protein n=1 Tax=Phyllosticta citrichinensis TaxID=1130410 RepID=A0ABR1XWA7_9PEZI